MNIKPYLFALLFIAAIVGGALLNRSCSRKPEPVKPETTAETVRKNTVAGRDKKNEQLAADTMRYLTANKALSRELNRLMLNGKQKDLLIAQLEAKYRKRHTLGSCDTLVREQKGRIDSLKSEVATRRKDSLNKETMLATYAEHLFDKDMRIDTLSKGWAEANLENGKLEKKIKRKNTLLKIGAGIIAVLGVLVAAR